MIAVLQSRLIAEGDVLGPMRKAVTVNGSGRWRLIVVLPRFRNVCPTFASENTSTLVEL